MSHPLRVAALVKQVPVIEGIGLGPDGRLQRDGLEHHMNDYCRRAVAKAHELARATEGTVTVLTLGPPGAEDVLREALAYGADRGVLVTDLAFGGSDTYATAKALAAALDRLGPFDLILMGRNSVDADTGQVPAQLAALLGLPLCSGVRALELDHATLRLVLEHDDERIEVEVELPAILSCAERLCEPCKVKDPARWATVDGALISRLSAADLGAGPWGQAASPTVVGEVRATEVTRTRRIVDGPIEDQIAAVLAAIDARGGIPPAGAECASPSVVVAAPTTLPIGDPIVVLVEPGRPRLAQELLGAAADLGVGLRARVVAVAGDEHAPLLSSWGADVLLHTGDHPGAEDVAGLVTRWSRANRPWAILGPGTDWGREVLGRASATLAAGMTGDAVALEAVGGRLVTWKPAFGGEILAQILCTSPIQVASVRAGVLPRRAPRAGADIEVVTGLAAPVSRVRVRERTREDDSAELTTATVVVGVGLGVDTADYPFLQEHADRFGAVLCATRKVTDLGRMPRARQVGITGHSVAPTLFLSLGASGKFNHMVGVRSATTIVAVNIDRSAPVFDAADIGIVGDWREVLPALASALGAARSMADGSIATAAG